MKIAMPTVNVPKHVAIIMDGNGRWAKTRSRPRFFGHIRGASIVSSIVEAASNAGIKSLTLYAFSTENWSRPSEEIIVLFKLLDKFLIREFRRVIQQNIRFRVIGRLEGISEKTKNLIQQLEHNSQQNTGLNLLFAFNYGARAEMVDVCKNLIRAKINENEITEDYISSQLYFPDHANLDLLIRTGGEKRISNFLLWQLAYAELSFVNELWPDFSVEKFREILNDFSLRTRNFGQVKKEEEDANLSDSVFDNNEIESKLHKLASNSETVSSV